MSTKEFWQAVFIASIRAGYSASSAASKADEAVNALCNREIPDAS